MPSVTQYLGIAGDVAADVTTLFTLYQMLEPGGKQFIDNEIVAWKAELATIKAKLDDFSSASTIGKISAGLSVLNAFGGFVTFAETTYKNGEQFLGADWAQIKERVDSIIAKLTNPTAAVSASTPLPPGATAEPAA